MRVDKVSRLRYFNQLSGYLKQYQEGYPGGAVPYILEHFVEDKKVEDTPDILMQLYAEFHLLSVKENYYAAFAKKIGKIYGWNTRILEIGGGFFPAFSRTMHAYQEKKGMGTITVYDPQLVVTKLEGISLKKEEFTKETDIKDYDLLVGIMPCTVTRLMIQKAIQEHKEFFIALCGCTHFDIEELPRSMFGFIPLSYEDWVTQVYALAKEQEKDGFEVTMEDAKQYSFQYPVIRSKRR